jgi:hypothetical protein
MSEKLYTLPEIEQMTGIHVGTLRRAANHGKLPAQRTGKDQRALTPFLVRQKDLDAYLEKRRAKEFKFNIFNGGKKGRKKKKSAPNRAQINDAVKRYLNQGNKIERRQPEVEPTTFNPAFLDDSEPTILDEIHGDLADQS